jgi:hypothetical protein
MTAEAGQRFGYPVGCRDDIPGNPAKKWQKRLCF